MAHSDCRGSSLVVLNRDVIIQYSIGILASVVSQEKFNAQLIVNIQYYINFFSFTFV